MKEPGNNTQQTDKQVDNVSLEACSRAKPTHRGRSASVSSFDSTKSSSSSTGTPSVRGDHLWEKWETILMEDEKKEFPWWAAGI
jgi:hypothetical protein